MDNLDKLKTFYRGYFEGYKMDQSLKALDLAMKFHTGSRKGGAPEVTHQFEIVNLLIQLLQGHCKSKQIDEIIASGFLHDVVEDYPDRFSFDDLSKNFSKDVYRTVKAVTKPADFDKYSETDHEKYYKQILKIPEAVLVKLGDRIQNVQTIGGLKLDRQKEYVVEVEEHFLPMLKKARRLYPNFSSILVALREILRRQIKFVKRIHELEDEIQELKSS
jgi:(p)ppGpp synthase/HD superfamily hydrolase